MCKTPPDFVLNQETPKIVNFYDCILHELAMSQQQFVQISNTSRVIFLLSDSFYLA